MTSVPNEPVLLRRDADAIATLTLNRPRQANALSDALLDELQSALDAIAKDPGIRVVVIEGAGKAFCAGHDLKEMSAHPDRAYHLALFKRCSHMMTSIARLPQPVIARVHGIATAAGCQLVASCDLAIASRSARFGTNGIDAGLFCTTPGVAIGRVVPRKHALDLLLTGRFIDAARAESIGLVNQVVDASLLDAAVAEMATTIAKKSSATVSLGKRAFYRQMDLDLDAAYDFASETMADGMMLGDAKEGIEAFMAKRAPVWKHK
ncbi:MAG: enoyl-CoA hydratase [Alphaproteobacteria bacterium]